MGSSQASSDQPRERDRPERRAAVRRRNRRRRLGHVVTGQVKSEINVTPFVDVVLVLLIIFMVVTPLLQRGVDVLLPLSDHHKDKKDTGEHIIISVARGGAIFLGNDRVDPRQLESMLRPLMQRSPPPPVFVKGDRRLTFGPMRKVLEACHRAGAQAVSLATQGRKGGGGE
jgi:biopolymer transport protein ExbD